MNTTRRGFLSSVAAIAPLSVCGLLPRRKRIKWKKTKWQLNRLATIATPGGWSLPLDAGHHFIYAESFRQWKAIITIPTSTYLQLICNACGSVNSDKYETVEPKHLRFSSSTGVRVRHLHCKATLVLTEKKYDQSSIRVGDPEGGLFGTPIVHQFEVYEVISFTDLFQKIEDA